MQEESWQVGETLPPLSWGFSWPQPQQIKTAPSFFLDMQTNDTWFCFSTNLCAHATCLLMICCNVSYKLNWVLCYQNSPANNPEITFPMKRELECLYWEELESADLWQVGMNIFGSKLILALLLYEMCPARLLFASRRG